MVDVILPIDSSVSRHERVPAPTKLTEEKTVAGTGHAEYRVPRDEGRISAEITNCEVSYPEGGLHAWLVVFGSFMGTIVSLGTVSVSTRTSPNPADCGSRSTIGIFHAHLSEHQLKDHGESTIGWIFGIYVFLTFFCGIQIGPIFDAHGPKLLLLIGSICLVASMLLLGLCTKYWHFVIVFGALGGVGTALLFTPAFAAIGHFFLKKRGNATGIAATGGALGGVIFPLMLQRLFASVGFLWATRTMALIFVICTGMAVALVRSRLSRKPGRSLAPDLSILKHRSYLLATVGTYFMEWALFVPITYLTTFSASLHTVNTAFPFEVVAIMNAGSCFGRWTSGYSADKLGHFNSMIAALAFCALTSLTLWLPLSIMDKLRIDSTIVQALVIIYALIFGFASGSNISLAPGCIGQLCDTHEYGRYYATCYAIVSFGTLTGIPIAGALVRAAGGHYWGVACWTFLCYIVSLGCFIWSRVCQVGWKWGGRV